MARKWSTSTAVQKCSSWNDEINQEISKEKRWKEQVEDNKWIKIAEMQAPKGTKRMEEAREVGKGRREWK